MTGRPPRRVLAVHLPQWPIQRLMHELPELARQPIVLYGKLGRQPRSVWACNELARQQGIRQDMPLVEVRRGFQGHVQEVDPESDLVALEQWAVECQRFTPYAGLEPEDSHRRGRETILLDIGPTAALFGGQEVLGRQVRDFFVQQGFHARLVIASHWAAAWALASYPPPAWDRSPDRSWLKVLESDQEAELIAGLPLEALRVSTGVRRDLEPLGIDRVGQVQQLPAASLPARFGPDLNRRLEELAGMGPQQIDICRAAETYRGQRILDIPTADLATLRHHVREILDDLMPAIVKQQSGVLSLHCQWLPCPAAAKWQLVSSLPEAESASEPQSAAPPLETSLRLVQPTQDSDYLLQLMDLQWERLEIPYEISRVQVLVPLTARDMPQQQWLFQDGRENQQAGPAALIDRLTARLGVEQVFQWRHQAQALPERRFVPRKRLARETAAGGGRPGRPGRKSRDMAGAKGATGAVGAAGTEEKVAGRSAGVPPAYLERPARLYHQPQPLEVIGDQRFSLPTQSRFWVPATFRLQGHRLQVQWAVGPERIESQWWEGRWVRRDYFRVQTVSGQRLWIFQSLSEGRWWLHGHFA